MARNPTVLPPDIPADARIIDLRPHRKQAELMNLFGNMKIQEVIAFCGRRFGKTYAAGASGGKFGLEHPKSPYAGWGDAERPPTEICVVGPDYKQAQHVYDEIKRIYGIVLTQKNDAEMRLTLTGGARVTVLTGNNISAARGSGFDLLILDEAVDISQAGFEADLAPTLLDRDGRLWIITTPRHGRKNWVVERYLSAQIAKPKGVATFHATSWDNPRISRKRLAREIETKDPLTVREEYYAEILEQSSSWLDASLINPIDEQFIPRNTFNVAIIDSAWGQPQTIDTQTKRRKDATVIAVLAQDTQGNVYLLDGHWAQDLQIEAGCDLLADYIRRYDCKRLVKEQVADDPFAGYWIQSYTRRNPVPTVGLVTPNRARGWKPLAIRHWAGTVLYRHKFFVKTGCPLASHLTDEMVYYNEADSKRDACQDDVLTAISDVMLPQIWQGHREPMTTTGPMPRRDLYNLDSAWADWRQGGPPPSRPIGKYSIMAK